jgi:hypothetical protein
VKNLSISLGSASLALALGATTAAADGTRGGSIKDAPAAGVLYSATIEASAGWTKTSGNDNDLDDKSYPLIMGAARLTLPLLLDWSAQLDLEGLSTFTSRNNGEDNLQTYFITGLHVARRDPARGALGVFGAVGSSNGGAEENATFFLGGLEAQKYLGNMTLYGQAGYFNADDETEGDVMTKAWFVRGVVRYFFDPNSRLQVELAHARGEELVGTEKIKTLNWGIRFDRQIDQRPISWFAAYDGLRVEDDNESVTDHRFRLGLAFRFGTGSLLENDRRGATFDLPDIGRWTGYTISVID